MRIRKFNESNNSEEFTLEEIESKYKDMFQEIEDLGFETTYDVRYYTNIHEKFENTPVYMTDLYSLRDCKNDLYIAIKIDVLLETDDGYFDMDNNILFELISILKVKRDNYDVKIYYSLEGTNMSIFILTNELMIKYTNLSKLLALCQHGKFISNKEFKTSFKAVTNKNILHTIDYQNKFKDFSYYVDATDGEIVIKIK